MKKIIFCAIVAAMAAILSSCGTEATAAEPTAEQQECVDANEMGYVYEPGVWYDIVRDHADIFEAHGYKVERVNGAWRYF